MKKLLLCFLLGVLQYQAFSQGNVGVGTTNPNSSSILDISSSNKGVLFPRVNLQSAVDNVTIPSPASGLIVYNTNAVVPGGVGLFYNAGTAASPNWTKVGDVILPLYKATSTNNSAFQIENYSSSPTSSAIKAYSFGGNALDVSGKMKISGAGQSPGQGKVLTSDANGNATWEGAVAFSSQGVVTTGSNSIAPNTFTKVRFATVNYDLNGNYHGPNDANHSSFIAPVNGIYHFDSKVVWDANYIDGYTVRFMLVRIRDGNKTVLHEHFDNFPDLPTLTQQISIDTKLQAGDQVYMEVRHTAEENVKLSEGGFFGYPQHYFNGRLVIKL